MVSREWGEPQSAPLAYNENESSSPRVLNETRWFERCISQRVKVRGKIASPTQKWHVRVSDDVECWKIKKKTPQQVSDIQSTNISRAKREIFSFCVT